MPADEFNVSIQVNITKNNSKFSDYKLDYTGLDYTQLQTLQNTISNALLGLGNASLKQNT